jgi:hypothetical protein
VRISDPTRPLGTIAVAKDASLTIAFSRPVALPLGSVVYIYGIAPATEKVNDQAVVTEARRVVAKAQVLEKMAHTGYRAQVFWQLDGVLLATGFDAIPEPDATVPDVPPVYQAEAVAGFKARLQETVIIRLPITDPEGLPLRFQWSLPDEFSGRLDSSTTVQPVIRWTAPGAPINTTLTVTATDFAGNAASWKIPLEVAPLHQDWRERKLTVDGRFGKDAEPALRKVERDDRGFWWGISRDADLVQIAPGWTDQKIISQIASAANISSPNAIVARNNELIVLDGSMGYVLSYTGVERARLLGLKKPVDLAVSPLGAIAVADQGLGGVAIYDANGNYRLVLGRTGEGAWGSVDRRI